MFKKLIIGALLASAGIGANASQFGCKVLLCLSDIRGAEHETECRPPIEKLKAELALGHAFPHCDKTDGNDEDNNYTKQVFDYFDPCPDGTVPAAQNSFVAEGLVVSTNQYGVASFKITGHERISESALSKFGGSPSARACVGKQLGTYWTGGFRNSGDEVNVYAQVKWQQPQPPHAIDVYINGKYFSRTRLNN